MKIIIKARPNAKTEKVEELKPVQIGSDTKRAGMPSYRVSVKATPTDGNANDAIIRALAKHFKVHASHVRIVSGHAARRKIVEITGGLL